MFMLECVVVYLSVCVCRHDSVLLYSQGHAVIIAASDSIMIQFSVLRGGAGGAVGH